MFWTATAVILAAAGLLRWTGMGTDLWLDELWSRRVAIAMASVFDAFTLNHEINHPLATVWLYLMGPDATAVQYRLPSFVCGIASVAVAGLIGRRRSIATGIFAMLLTGLSYELIVFSSEARGYSMAVLCTLLCLLLLEQQLERPRWTLAAAYAAVTSIGLYTQPVFSVVLASACLWSVVRWARSTPRSLRSTIDILAPQVLPLAAFALLYIFNLRHIISGGGSTTPSLIDVYGQSLAWALGTPNTAAMKLVSCVLAVVVIDAGLRDLRRSSRDAWLYFVGAIVIFPSLAVIVRGSEIVYTRHFLLGGVLTLILLAFVLGAWWARGRAWRAAAVAVLALFGVANGLHVRTFGELGRGGYREAIQYMADHTDGPTLTIGGDQDFRISLELDYYLPRVLGRRPARYFRDGSWPPGGPVWLIGNADHYESPTIPDNLYSNANGNEFEYVRTYPTSPLTGLHWFLFKNRTAR